MKKQNLGDVSNLTSLTLEGENYSREDLAYLETLTQLTSLAFSEKPMYSGREGGLYYSNRWNVDCFPNLETFTMPCNRGTIFESSKDTKVKNLICDYYPRFYVQDQILFLNSLTITEPMSAHFRSDYAYNSSSYSEPWSGYYGIYDERDFESVEVLVGNLVLPSVNTMLRKDEDVESFMSAVLPVFINFRDKEFIVMNYYNSNFVGLESLGDVRYLSPYLFAGSDIKEITLPENITVVPRYCFANCDSLETVNMEGVKMIKNFAFQNSAIKQIHIPASVEELETNAFAYSNLEYIYLDGPAPKWFSSIDGRDSHAKASDVFLYTDALFVVPQEYADTYKTGIWEELKPVIVENSIKPTFTSKQPGEMALFVDHLGEKAKDVMDLKINGILDDNDLVWLSRFPNLTILDLSDCLILKSEFTAYQEYLYYKGMREIAEEKLQSMRKNNEMEHDAGWRSSQSYRENKLYLDAALKELKKYDSKYEKPNDGCYLPENAFVLNRHLFTVVLPKSLTNLKHRFDNSVKHVILPPNLKIIGRDSFSRSKIVSLEFPSSLESIGHGCFAFCKNLKEVDLSQTSIEKLPVTLFYESAVLSVKAPKGLKELTRGDVHDMITPRWDTPVVYYYTAEPPEGMKTNIEYKQTIHVPKGSAYKWESKLDYELSRNEAVVVDDL